MSRDGRVTNEQDSVLKIGNRVNTGVNTIDPVPDNVSIPKTRGFF